MAGRAGACSVGVMRQEWQRPTDAPLVTAIIPTHDRAGLIMRAVASALGQTYPNMEVIVVDDGSGDDTPARLAAVADPRLRVIRHERAGGVSAARNAGIAVARGAYVALLDSDDEWLPEKIARQLAYMVAGGYLLCQTQEIWMRSGRRVNPSKVHNKPDGYFFEAALTTCLVSPSTTLFDRVFFEAVGVFDEGLPACEDYDLWLRTLLCHPIGLVDADLTVRHGGRGDQLSTMYLGQDLFRIRSMVGLLTRPETTSWHRDCIEKELRRKTRVYATGCFKRDRPEEAQRVLALVETALLSAGDREKTAP